MDDLIGRLESLDDCGSMEPPTDSWLDDFDSEHAFLCVLRNPLTKPGRVVDHTLPGTGARVSRPTWCYRRITIPSWGGQHARWGPTDALPDQPKKLRVSNPARFPRCMFAESRPPPHPIHAPHPNRVRDWWRQGPGHPPPPRVEVRAPAGCLAVRRRRDHSSLGVLCFRRRVPSRVHGAGPPPAGADFGTYRWPHPQESGRVLIRPYRLSVGTRHPPQSWRAAGGGDSRPARAWGPQGVPEEPTNWQGLGRLAYFAVVSGSPAKFAVVGCPGLRTGSVDPITATPLGISRE